MATRSGRLNTGVCVANSLVEDVSDTAFWVAHHRGMEGERADALFRDPLAARLAGERGRQIARAMPGSRFTSWTIVIRTCIIDDFIRFAIADGVDTVLNLGAGLDTRPYRMDLPATLTWIEADYPSVIAFKEEQLASERPRCRLVRHGCDLADKGARTRFLADAQARAGKMLVLTEGVILYLPEAAVAELADDLRRLDRAAYWIVDYLSPLAAKLRPKKMNKILSNAPLQFQPADWYGFFETHGWRCKEMRYMSEEGERLNRRPELSLWAKLMWAVRIVIASKKKREAFRKVAGYALMEPAVRG
jgi:methyltransferase (TIGR00027 family)